MKKLIAALCCAVAVAVFYVPGARADEYTKQTFLTFSAPVQVPGATLPAGTYMFKLADPDSGRRAIQIWDKDGGKLIATLLTIPNQMMETPDEPVVLFSEQAIGQPAAVKAWFYPGDRIGQEFIYPKDQAMRIAQSANTSVLAYNSDNPGADAAAMRGSQVGRVDSSGQVAAADTTDNTSTAATADNTAARAATAPSASAQASAAQASTTDNTTSAATADHTAASATNSNAQSAQANRTPPASPSPQPASASTSTASAPAPTASTASANRSGAADRTAVSGQAGTTAPAPVGTTGQTAAPQSAPRQEGTTASRQELPRTASPMTTIQLLAGLSLLGSLSLRQVRKRRFADNRL